MANYMGKDGFIWWQGVVEDRHDPLYLGRCRVRILGWHTDNKAEMPTESLPWCYPVQPIISAAQTGVGISPTGPVEGTWVVGFYRDGEDAQEPVFFGTLGGIPEAQAGVGEAFADPRTEDPPEDAHPLSGLNRKLLKYDVEEEAQKELISDSKEITGKVIKKNTMSWDTFKEEKENKKIRKKKTKT